MRTALACVPCRTPRLCQRSVARNVPPGTPRRSEPAQAWQCVAESQLCRRDATPGPGSGHPTAGLCQTAEMSRPDGSGPSLEQLANTPSHLVGAGDKAGGDDGRRSVDTALRVADDLTAMRAELQALSQHVSRGFGRSTVSDRSTTALGPLVLSPPPTLPRRRMPARSPDRDDELEAVLAAAERRAEELAASAVVAQRVRDAEAAREAAVAEAETLRAEAERLRSAAAAPRPEDLPRDGRSSSSDDSPRLEGRSGGARLRARNEEDGHGRRPRHRFTEPGRRFRAESAAANGSEAPRRREGRDGRGRASGGRGWARPSGSGEEEDDGAPSGSDQDGVWSGAASRETRQRWRQTGDDARRWRARAAALRASEADRVDGGAARGGSGPGAGQRGGRSVAGRGPSPFGPDASARETSGSGWADRTPVGPSSVRRASAAASPPQLTPPALGATRRDATLRSSGMQSRWAAPPGRAGSRGSGASERHPTRASRPQASVHWGIGTAPGRACDPNASSSSSSSLGRRAPVPLSPPRARPSDLTASMMSAPPPASGRAADPAGRAGPGIAGSRILGLPSASHVAAPPRSRLPGATPAAAASPFSSSSSSFSSSSWFQPAGIGRGRPSAAPPPHHPGPGAAPPSPPVPPSSRPAVATITDARWLAGAEPRYAVAAAVAAIRGSNPGSDAETGALQALASALRPVPAEAEPNDDRPSPAEPRRTAPVAATTPAGRPAGAVTLRGTAAATRPPVAAGPTTPRRGSTRKVGRSLPGRGGEGRHTGRRASQDEPVGSEAPGIAALSPQPRVMAGRRAILAPPPGSAAPAGSAALSVPALAAPASPPGRPAALIDASSASAVRSRVARTVRGGGSALDSLSALLAEGADVSAEECAAWGCHLVTGAPGPVRVVAAGAFAPGSRGPAAGAASAGSGPPQPRHSDGAGSLALPRRPRAPSGAGIERSEAPSPSRGWVAHRRAAGRAAAYQPDDVAGRRPSAGSARDDAGGPAEPDGEESADGDAGRRAAEGAGRPGPTVPAAVTPPPGAEGPARRVVTPARRLPLAVVLAEGAAVPGSGGAEAGGGGEAGPAAAGDDVDDVDAVAAAVAGSRTGTPLRTVVVRRGAGPGRRGGLAKRAAAPDGGPVMGPEPLVGFEARERDEQRKHGSSHVAELWQGAGGTGRGAE